MSSQGHTQSSSRRDGFSSLNLKYLLLALYSDHYLERVDAFVLYINIQLKKL